MHTYVLSLANFHVQILTQEKIVPTHDLNLLSLLYLVFNYLSQQQVLVELYNSSKRPLHTLSINSVHGCPHTTAAQYSQEVSIVCACMFLVARGVVVSAGPECGITVWIVEVPECLKYVLLQPPHSGYDYVIEIAYRAACASN